MADFSCCEYRAAQYTCKHAYGLLSNRGD